MDTCTHRLAAGLTGRCSTCQEEYDADPLAWIEYGCHPEGERRYRELLEEFALDTVYVPTENCVPFASDDETPY